ncbi:MAG: hypothetical protein KKE73_07690 [Proteobacteria bacterium]|nr:hypothetical protein [Pseudomonadota bacterium]
MDNAMPSPAVEKDPVTELYDVASALRFLEDAFEGHDEAGTQVRASGAAYVTGLVGRRVNAIACILWDLESDLAATVQIPPTPKDRSEIEE